MKLAAKWRLLPLVSTIAFGALLVSGAQGAAKIPTLSGSAQYKALVKFVDKLDALANTPATSARKDSLADQLESKHAAALNKSTALFTRAKAAARNETSRAFRASSKTIRTTESGELATLRREYDGRLDRAASTYAAELNRIADEFGARVATLRAQIKKLRKQKAKASGEVEKKLAEEAIDRRLVRIAVESRLEKEEVTDLKAGFRKEKTAIQAGKASATQLVLQDDDAAIEKLRSDQNRIFDARVRTLQAKRVNQVGDLEGKLDAGRAAIERMPLAG